MADPKRLAALHKQGGVYKPMSEITPGTQDLLDSPSPGWLDREYPYVAPPSKAETLHELDYLISLTPLREEWASFIRAADEDMAGLFVTLCSELGAPCDKQMLSDLASEASILITKLKWLYNRPRPSQVAEKHLRLSGQGGAFKKGDFAPLNSKTAHTPAYPSGHTIQANLFAARLSEAAPQHRKAFMDLAERVSFSRAVAGYHWPSDLVFGKDIFRHIVMPLMPSAVRVAKTYTVNKGDLVWYGKYKNQRGEVKNLGMGDKGDPTITVEQLPAPSARKPKKKSPKTLNLFSIRPRKKDEHDEADETGKKASGPVKYEHIDFVPPEGVASAAAKGLELRQKASPSNKGGLTPAEASKEGIGSGVQRAVNLKNRDPVSPKVIKQIRGFLSRSEKSSEISAENRGTPWNDKGYVAWLLWGGDPAKAWTDKIIKQMDAADEKAAKTAAVRSAASKALSKKEVPKADGSGTSTVYEYGPRQVALRNKEKAVRIEALRQKITDLRKQVHADLTSEDPDTRLAALAVSLIDETYARVGNEKSAKAGHHGVTNWQTDHVTLADKSATIRYTGKSGVEQAKRITNARVLAALRKALEGKSKGDKVLCDGDECSILAKDVNIYLKPFEITAKDIRGLHANEEMKHHLKEQRKAGPELPRARKDKDKILKAEFKAALELASAAVGHKDSTLRSQYLVPSMEASYTHDGTVLDSLDKKATLSDSEKEDRESARLVRQSPKLKPPRKDKERGRVKDTDPNTDPDKAQDQKDRSRNYKDASARVALRYLVAAATATKPASTPERKKFDVGDTWQNKKDKKWSAKGRDGIQPGFSSEQAAKAWLTGGPKPGADSAPAAEGGSPAEAPTPKPPAKKGPLTRSQKRKMVETLSEGLAQGAGTTLGKLPEALLRAVAEELGEPAKAVVDAMLGDTASLEERATFAKATLKRIPSGKNPSPKEIADANALLNKSGELEDLQEKLEDLQDAAPTASFTLSGILATKKKVEDALKEEAEAAQKVADTTDAEGKKNAQKALDSLSKKVRGLPSLEALTPGIEEAKVVDAHEKKVKALTAEIKGLQKATKTVKAAEDWEKAPSPKEIADALVATRAAEVRKDPLLLDLSNPLTSKSTETLGLEGAAQKEFMDKMGDLTVSTTDEYRQMPKEDREAHRKGLGEHLDKLEKDGHTDTEQYHSTLAQIRGLQMASALEDGKDAVGVNSAFQTFLKAAESQGGDVLDKFIKLNVTGAAEGDAGAQQQFRDVLREVPPEELAEMVEEDNPARGVLERLNGSHLNDGTNAGRRKQKVWNKYMDDETAQLLREHAEDMIMDEIMFTDMDMVREGKTTGEQKKNPSKKTEKQRSVRKSKTKSLLELLAKTRSRVEAELALLFPGKGTSPSSTKKANHTLTEAYDFAPWGAFCTPKSKILRGRVSIPTP